MKPLLTAGVEVLAPVEPSFGASAVVALRFVYRHGMLWVARTRTQVILETVVELDEAIAVVGQSLLLPNGKQRVTVLLRAIAHVCPPRGPSRDGILPHFVFPRLEEGDALVFLVKVRSEDERDRVARGLERVGPRVGALRLRMKAHAGREDFEFPIRVAVVEGVVAGVVRDTVAGADERELCCASPRVSAASNSSLPLTAAESLRFLPMMVSRCSNPWPEATALVTFTWVPAMLPLRTMRPP